MDPLTKKYPDLTPYQFASNTPILAVDLDGREASPYPQITFEIEKGLSRLRNPKASELKINIEAAINTVFDDPIIQTPVRALAAPLDVYEYTNRNSNQRDPKIRAENSNMAASAALNTIIGYASGKAIGSVFEGLLSKPVKAPYAPEVVIAQETGLYRGDTRSPDEIFKSGFESKGTNTDVVDYVEANTPSVFVGTSKNASEALQKVNTKGYVYVIGNNGAGLDINNYYKAVEDRVNPHASEQEVIFEGKIPSSQIQGAYPVINGKINTNGFIKNPAYQAPQTTGTTGN